MRRYILLSLAGLALIAAAILWTTHRGADEDALAKQRTLTARAESALDAADYDALEERLSQAHAAAVATRDFKPLRATYATLFVVANRDRFAQTRAWRAAVPDSPYAATALAWQHYQRAFEFRGNALSPYVSQEARAHYHDELEQAQKLAEGGFAKRDDSSPRSICCFGCGAPASTGCPSSPSSSAHSRSHRGVTRSRSGCRRSIRNGAAP